VGVGTRRRDVGQTLW